MEYESHLIYFQSKGTTCCAVIGEACSSSLSVVNELQRFLNACVAMGLENMVAFLEQDPMVLGSWANVDRILLKLLLMDKSKVSDFLIEKEDVDPSKYKGKTIVDFDNLTVQIQIQFTPVKSASWMFSLDDFRVQDFNKNPLI